METEQCKNGKSYCEIDEYKIINYNNENRWMFGIFDRGTHNNRIFFVDNNRTKDIKDYMKNILNLLQIQIAKNILNSFRPCKYKI